jgi:hypothetical protein
MSSNFKSGKHKFDILYTIHIKKGTGGFFPKGANIFMVGIFSKILFTRFFIKEKIVNIFVTSVCTQI